MFISSWLIQASTLDGVIGAFTQSSCAKLASADEYFAYARLPIVRAERRWASLYESCSFIQSRCSCYFVVLHQMTGAFWQSAFVASLFAIHPLHVESVAWMCERKDVLSADFFLLTLWALPALCARAIGTDVMRRGVFPRSRTDVETDARDRSHCPSRFWITGHSID